MAWAETRPGHWQRPIGENEAMIKMIGEGGRKFEKDVWSIAVTASFIADIEAKSLSQALLDGWKTLRFHHPSIATTVNEGILEYYTPGPLELAQWADETFVVLDHGIKPDDVIAGLTPRRFATLFFLREHGSVLLHLSHWRTDGIGAFQLLDAYFQAVMDSLSDKPLELPWGKEGTRLVPSVEEALKLPRALSPTIERAAKRYLDTLKYNVGNLGTPYAPGGNGIIPKGTRGARRCFSPKLTADLQNACHRLNIPLEAAVHAAVTATAYSIADPTSRSKHHSSTMRHSLRPHLPPPYDGAAGSAGLYTAGYIIQVPASQSWLENARRYEADYGQGVTPDLLLSRRQYALEMRRILKGNPPPSSSAIPPSGLDISYIPNAQTLVKAVRRNAMGAAIITLREIGIGVQVLSRHIYVFVWVFTDRLEFHVVYNEAFYEDGLVRRILALIETHLVSNLLLDEDFPDTDLKAAAG